MAIFGKTFSCYSVTHYSACQVTWIIRLNLQNHTPNASLSIPVTRSHIPLTFPSTTLITTHVGTAYLLSAVTDLTDYLL